MVVTLWLLLSIQLSHYKSSLLEVDDEIGDLHFVCITCTWRDRTTHLSCGGDTSQSSPCELRASRLPVITQLEYSISPLSVYINY